MVAAKDEDGEIDWATVCDGCCVSDEANNWYKMHCATFRYLFKANMKVVRLKRAIIRLCNEREA